MKQYQTIEQVQKVKSRHETTLLRLANVLGVGIGLKETEGQLTDQVALIVNVIEKKPLSELEPNDVVPTELDGLPTDVQEVEQFSAF